MDINRKIFEELKATSAFVAILKHHGKLSVPRENLMELVNEKQIWPNDFITKNGSAMCVTYDEKTDEIGFELKYKSDGDIPENSIGFQCTRNTTNVGHVDYNSPYYKD